MPRKPTFQEAVYWGTFLFSAVLVAYLLVTLINLSSQEESAFQTATNYRDQTRFVTVLTSEGSFKIAFMRAQAPITVKNFVRLAQSGFYDKTEFYDFRDGVFVENDASDGLQTPHLQKGNSSVLQVFEEGVEEVKITRGLVAMPSRGESLVDGRQLLFFIEDDTSVLGEGYAVFGRVIEGMDVVEKINGSSASLESIVID